MNIYFKTIVHKILIMQSIVLFAFIANIIYPVSVSASQCSLIMGDAIANKEEMVKYYQENSPISYPQEYLNQGVELHKFVNIVVQEAEAEGVRADVAFAQIIVQTEWLDFSGQIDISQNNFGELKDQDGNYLSFQSIEGGVRANIQLLKGYASNEVLNQEKITPLYDMISPKGQITNVENLGNGNWSQEPEYGKKIKEQLNQILSTKTIVSSEGNLGESVSLEEFVTTGLPNDEIIQKEANLSQEDIKETDDKVTENQITQNIHTNLTDQVITTNSVSQPTQVEPLAEVKTLDINGSGYVGVQHEITSLGTSLNGVLYQFWIKDLSTNQWTMIQDYSRSGVRWTPTKPGKYWYGVHIKDINSTESLDAHLYKEITIKSAEIKTLEIDGSGYVGDRHEITSLGKSPNGVLYQFWIKDLSTNQWTMIQDYSRSGVRWTPTKPGKYWYGVHIKDINSIESLDAYLYKEITINKIQTEVRTLEIDGPGYVGERHEITSLGKSPNGVLYQFWIKDLSINQWTMIQDYSRSGAGWTPTKPGKYLYGVHIKDLNSTESLDAHLYKEITINKIPAEVQTLEIDGTGYVGDRHEITSLGKSPNGVLYQFWIKDLSTNQWTMIQDYSRSGVAWTPTKPGKYLYGVHIKDLNSTESLDAHLYKEIVIKSPVIYKSSYYYYTLEEMTNIQMIKGDPKADGAGKIPATREQVLYYVNPNNFLQFQPILGKPEDYELNYLKITANVLNVRSVPSTINNVPLGTVKKNETYQILDKSLNGWYKIRTNNNILGWVSGDSVALYTDKSSDDESILAIEITGNGLRVRNKPIDGDVLTQVNSGEIYIVQERSDGWYKITAKGEVGWVSSDYTKLVNKVPKEMYQFLVLSGSSGISIANLNQELSGKGMLDGTGEFFIKAGKEHNVNELYLYAHALHETGIGTSPLANGRLVDTVDGKPVEPKVVYNMYGIGAKDGDAIRLGAEYAYKQKWFTVEDAIIGGAKWIANGYIDNQQDTLYKMKWNPSFPGTHQYATHYLWAVAQTKYIETVMEVCDKYNSAKLKFDIPVFKP